jgi:type I restriction enzyme M protein
MNLHEAIQSVLNAKGQSLKPRDIALEINRFALYTTGDGKAVSPNQVLSRAKRYPDLFQIDPTNQISLKSGLSTDLSYFSDWLRNFLSHRYSPDLEIVIPFIIFTYIINSEVFDKYGYLSSNYMREQNLHKKDIVVRCRQRLDAMGINLQHDFFSSIENALFNIDDEEYVTLLVEFFNILNRIPDDKKLLEHVFIRAILQLGNSKSKGSEFSTPKSVSNFIRLITNIRSGQSVYDPFAGMAILLNEVVKHSSNIKISANDINRRVGVIGIMNLIINGKTNFEYTFGNAFDARYRVVYDWIVTNPPFNVFNLSSRLQRSYNMDAVLESLKSNGKAVLIVNNSLLISEDRRNLVFREQLLRTNVLKAVIGLPKNIFQPFSNYPTSIIFLDREIRNEKVYFLDLSEVSREEFEYKVEDYAKNYNEAEVVGSLSYSVHSETILSTRTFNLNARKNILSNTQFTDIPNPHALNSLVLKRLPSKMIPSNELNDKFDGIPYIRVSDLAKRNSEYVLDFAPEKYTTDFERAGNKSNQVQSGDILISKVGNSLNPTVYNYFEYAVVSPNVIGLSLKRNLIIPEYLAIELESDYVKRQLDAIQIRGAGPNYYNNRELLDIEINVPSLEQQEKRIINFYSSTKTIKNDGSLSKTRFPDKLPKENPTVIGEKEIISSIKHRISQYISPINNDLLSLKNFLASKEQSTDAVSLEEPVVPVPGGTSVANVFNRLDENIDGISRTFGLMHSILYFSANSLELEYSDILITFNKIKVSLQPELGSIEFQIGVDDDIRKDDLLIEFDHNQIEELLRNFTLNSKLHGFDETVDPKIIYIFFSKSSDSNFLEINLINNGKPFPDGFTLEDFTSFGTRGTNSSGTGIGGYLMKKIIENHNGEIEWYGDQRLRFSLKIDNKPTSFIATVFFKILLPYTTT